MVAEISLSSRQCHRANAAFALGEMPSGVGQCPSSLLKTSCARSSRGGEHAGEIFGRVVFRVVQDRLERGDIGPEIPQRFIYGFPFHRTNPQPDVSKLGQTLLHAGAHSPRNLGGGDPEPFCNLAKIKPLIDA